MRRILVRKRRRFSNILFVTALCWVGVGMGFDVKSGLIARDFNSFLEKKLDTIFIDKDVRSSKITGGVFDKLTINDFSVYQKTPASVVGAPKDKKGPLVFSSDRVIIKYNALDLLLRRFDRFGGIYLISPTFAFVPGRPHEFSLPIPVRSLAKDLAGKRGNAVLAGLPGLGKSHGQVGQTGPIVLHILNGKIMGLGKKPVLSNLDGDVTYFRSVIVFNNLKGKFFDLPVVVNGRIENPSRDPVMKLRILVNEKYYTARIAVKNIHKKDEVSVQGSIRLFDRFDIYVNGKINIVSGRVIGIRDLAVKDLFSINGGIDLSNKSGKFIIKPKTGTIDITSSIGKNNNLSVYANLKHLNLFGLDVLSRIAVNTTLYKTADSSSIFRGALRTENLILNLKPFKDVKANWVMKKGKLLINSIELGDEYTLSGKVDLVKPYKVEMVLTINNAAIGDWLLFAKNASPDVLSGIMNGKIQIAGPLGALTTKGSVQIKDGNIRDFRFKAINLNLAGKGPIINISDSRVLEEGGFLYINGEIDLRKLGRRNLFENTRVTTDQKVIVWEGWDISKDSSEVRVKRQLNEGIDINFKTYKESDNISKDKNRSEIGLDYDIKNDNNINVRVKDDNSAFVGVEHKVKF